MPRAYLSRRYRFSASHRLHTDVLSAEENQRAFGKCNNPHGHGHNYVVEITVAGQIDAATGMVCDLGVLDGFANEQVVSRFDHTNLNTLPCFAEQVSTTENLNIEVARIFQSFTAAQVVRVHVEETSNNSFDFIGSLPATPGRP
ncbi:MAG: 6-carboxytetrahydropterin synthase [Acidobacteriota bacterium]|nr:6-carboxytetrahydropterin synthase [Acidobacteriota bacterium]